MTVLEILESSAPAFGRGVLVMLSVWAVSLILGGALGLFFGWFRYGLRSESKALHAAVETLTTVLKAVPVLILLVWVHYVSTPLLHVVLQPFVTASIVFSSFTAISVSEIFLAALMSIPQGEREAAYAIGMGTADALCRVILPLAIRASIPAIALLSVELLKLTTLASVIALGEVLHVADTIIAQTYVAVPTYTALAIIFLTLVLPVQFAAERFAQRWEIRR
jgi:polar amino acid transport system permease protein